MPDLHQVQNLRIKGLLHKVEVIVHRQEHRQLLRQEVTAHLQEAVRVTVDHLQVVLLEEAIQAEVLVEAVVEAVVVVRNN